jgi:hypothetical protein
MAQLTASGSIDSPQRFAQGTILFWPKSVHSSDRLSKDETHCLVTILESCAAEMLGIGVAVNVVMLASYTK